MLFNQPESKALPELLDFASSKSGTERRTFPNRLNHLVGQKKDTDHGNQAIEKSSVKPGSARVRRVAALSGASCRILAYLWRARRNARGVRKSSTAKFPAKFAESN